MKITKRQIGSSKAVLFRRLWVKLLLAYLIPVFLVLLIIGYLAYRALWISMENQLGEGLISIARTASKMVGKPRALRLMREDEESRTYINLMSKLREIQQAARVDIIYMFDERERALVDSRGRFPIGERIVKLAADRSELSEVFQGRDKASVLFAGNDGRLYKTGFSPVWLDEKVKAAIGVDGSAGFLQPLKRLRNLMVAMSLATLLLVTGLSLLISRLITRPLARLTESAGIIGSGCLDCDVKIETRDEIGLLAYTLNEMRMSIQNRDQMLQMMLAGIAHEVRNPLGGMALFLGLLKAEVDGNETALSHCERVETELDHLSRVVSDFLDYARQRPLELEELDPREEIEHVKALSEKELEEEDLDLTFEVSEEIKNIVWDRERMRRVLLNLVRNAIQASPKKGLIRVKFQREDSVLIVSVIDRGLGIPADQQGKVFEPFFTTRQQGTGLGLSLAKKTVEAHGGSIQLESTPGAGSSFSIRLLEKGVKK